MDRENVKGLRMDVRLISRRGWIPEQELDREIAELPDVSHKVAAAGSAAASDDGGTDPVA